MAEEALDKYLREINPPDGWRTSEAYLRKDATEYTHRPELKKVSLTGADRQEKGLHVRRQEIK